MLAITIQVSTRTSHPYIPANFKFKIMQALKKLQKDCTKEVNRHNFPLQTEIIYRKSHSETLSHCTFMESHRNAYSIVSILYLLLLKF